jgi:hypothetical protein
MKAQISSLEGLDSRFPKHSRPISEAPTATSAPITVYESDGSAHKSLSYKGQWMKLQPVKNPYSGATEWRMDSYLAVPNPVRWTPD